MLRQNVPTVGEDAHLFSMLSLHGFDTTRASSRLKQIGASRRYPVASDLHDLAAWHCESEGLEPS
jgi:hypothetical protein